MANITTLDQMGKDGLEPWTINGVISGLTILWGDPGLGKSFVAQSMAASVTSGRPWMGHKTAEGPVLFIAGEGGRETVGLRLKTALEQWKIDPMNKDQLHHISPIYVVTPGVDLVGGPTELVDLVGSKRPQLIVVDTLSRCFLGDENKQDDMGKFVKSLDLLRHHYGSDILVIHHSNRQHEIRGSSVLFGAADVSWHLTRQRGVKGEGESQAFGLVMQADKLRERPPDDGLIRLRAESVEITGFDGKPVYNDVGARQTTLVIKPTKKDLQTIKKVRDIGNNLLAKSPQLKYVDWRGTAKVEGREFDAAVSFIVTYPGYWGIMRGPRVATFVKAKPNVEHIWR